MPVDHRHQADRQAEDVAQQARYAVERFFLGVTRMSSLSSA
jgi:hypothetical protein